jgi:hypothetical protein
MPHYHLTLYHKITLIQKSSGYSMYHQIQNSGSLFCPHNLFICFITFSRKSILFPQPNFLFNPLTPNDHYSGRTAPRTSKRFILYIYSTNIGTEYFKHGIYSKVFFSSKCSLFHNSNIFGSCIIHILFTGCAKIKKIIPAPKG